MTPGEQLGSVVEVEAVRSAGLENGPESSVQQGVVAGFVLGVVIVSRLACWRHAARGFEKPLQNEEPHAGRHRLEGFLEGPGALVWLAFANGQHAAQQPRLHRGGVGLQRLAQPAEAAFLVARGKGVMAKLGQVVGLGHGSIEAAVVLCGSFVFAAFSVEFREFEQQAVVPAKKFVGLVEGFQGPVHKAAPAVVPTQFTPCLGPVRWAQVLPLEQNVADLHVSTVSMSGWPNTLTLRLDQMVLSLCTGGLPWRRRTANRMERRSRRASKRCGS